MEPETLDALKYPIGKFKAPERYDARTRQEAIDVLRHLPANLEHAIENLDAHQMQTPYRPEGWNLVQLIHHVADSHMNSFIRFKLAMTEDNPTIRPYQEALWAKLADGTTPAVNLSLTLLHALHSRWVILLESLTEADFARTLVHPATGRVQSLDELLAIYAWHSQHHLHHILSLRERMNW